MTPCNCDPVPARSHLEAREGAELVHVTDAAGTWHGVRLGEQFHRVALLQPSAEYLEAHREQPDPREARRAELRAAAAGRRITAAEIQEALEHLL